MTTADQEGDSSGLPMNLDIAVKDPAWDDDLAEPEPICVRAIRATLDELTEPKLGELSIALTNDAEIQTLNKSYRNKDKPTNVLSFPDDGPAPLLGDIVVARETVRREASAAGKTFENHFIHLIIHSFLHLQGFDHETDADAHAMEAYEIAALARLGIDNPYQIKESTPTKEYITP